MDLVNLKRICGRCGIELTKENTGGLQWLQPACNDCTNKHESECQHKWFQATCYLCGYVSENAKIIQEINASC